MRIGVVGLGIIGTIWARHWHADGHQLHTWNRTPRPDAPGWTPDLAELARACDLIAIVVADPAALAQVLDGLLPGLRAGCVVAQHSTVGVNDVQRAAQRVAAAGGRLLDLPFTGSKPAAEARQNVFFLGCEGELPAEVAAVYAQVGQAVLAVGGTGQAMALKLAMNTLIANVGQATVEALALAERAGIPSTTFFSCLERNVARSPLSEMKRVKWLDREWSPQFSVQHMHKDLRLALALAERLEQPMPQTRASVAAYAQVEADGHAADDMSAASLVVRP